jgi:hemerythrin
MKPFLLWRTDWLLGFDEFDQHHTHIAGLMNSLCKVLGNDSIGANRELPQLLIELLESMRCHFHDEEAFMQLSDYPQLPKHHREHAMLLAELQELIREVEEGRRRFTLQALTALKHWLIDHVLNSDKAFATFAQRSLAKMSNRHALAESTSISYPGTGMWAVAASHLKRGNEWSH